MFPSSSCSFPTLQKTGSARNSIQNFANFSLSFFFFLLSFVQNMADYFVLSISLNVLVFVYQSFLARLFWHLWNEAYVNNGDVYRYTWFTCPSFYLLPIAIVSGIISIPLVHILFWDEFREWLDWKSAPITVIDTVDNYYRCCKQVNCDCESQYNLDIPVCSEQIALLNVSVCSTNDYCCHEITYDCENCTQCFSYGYRTRCETICGDCSEPTVNLFFFTDDDESNFEEVSLATNCGLENNSCIESFYDQHVDDDIIWYKSSDPTDTSFTPFEFTEDMAIATLFFYFIFLAASCYQMIAGSFLLFKYCCKW